MPSNPTAETIIGLARNILRQDADSDTPTVQDSFMLPALSDGNMKWARAFYGSGAPPILFQRDTGFDLADDTHLNGAITTASTSVIVDSSDDFDTTDGAFVVWDDAMADVIFYTTNTVASETFSGVTNIGFAHEDDDAVQKLYKLPTNFGTFRMSPDHGDGVQLNGIPLFYRGGPPDPGFFSTVTDGTNTFLWLPRNSTGSASVWYNKTSATIDSVDDTVDVPDEFKFFLVWHLVAYAYIGRADEVNLMLYAQNESNKILQEALRVRNTGRKIRTRPLGRPYRDFLAIDGRYIGI